MSLNVELLQRIKAHILEEPKRYFQQIYGSRVAPENGGPACGTVACLAGWAVILSGEELFQDYDGVSLVRGDVERRAYQLTGIPENGAVGSPFATAAFWPAPFARQWYTAPSTEAKARVAADYIDFIIATKGDK